MFTADYATIRATSVIALAALLTLSPAPAPQAPGPDPPTTLVVTHGFQSPFLERLAAGVVEPPEGGVRPDWPVWIARAVVERYLGRIFLYSPSDGSLALCDRPAVHPACDLPVTPGAVDVVVFDWADDSNAAGTGYSEAAGEALLALLLAEDARAGGLLDLDALHLVGHSRGAVVNSEAAERLVALGRPPLQVTSLDPHDWGLLGEWADFDVNDLHGDAYACGDPPGLPPGTPAGVCAWEQVGFHDNYWHSDGSLFDLNGRAVPGSAELLMDDLGTDGGTDDIVHTNVHCWYYFTVPAAADPHPGGPSVCDPATPPAGWWDTGACLEGEARTGALARDVDGYNFSSVAGGELERCEPVGDRVPVAFDFFLREGLVNGDFEKEAADGEPVAGWSYHGGGGTGEVADDGGDRFLRLAGGGSMTHNRALVPAAAGAVSFCRRVLSAGGGAERLELALAGADGDVLLYTEELPAPSDWACVEAELPRAVRGTVGRLRFELVGGDGAVTVDLDDLLWVDALFADGFESGSTDAWDSVVD